MDRLAGKTAIITGAACGIGRATAKAFVHEGAAVFLCDVNEDALQECVSSIQRETSVAGVACARCDITLVSEVTTAVQACVDTLDTPNVLVNNAGRNFFNTPLETGDEQWQRCIDNDCTGAWNCCKAVLPYMIKNRDGAIVNIASVHGHKIIPHCFPYPVAKHALIGLTKALGVEYAKHNVRVNSISPGLIETEGVFAWYESMVAQGQFQTVEQVREQQAQLLPCARIGAPEEVAMTTVFLSSNEARFINASDIIIDGGRSALYHD